MKNLIMLRLLFYLIWFFNYDNK